MILFYEKICLWVSNIFIWACNNRKGSTFNHAHLSIKQSVQKYGGWRKYWKKVEITSYDQIIAFKLINGENTQTYEKRKNFTQNLEKLTHRFLNMLQANFADLMDHPPNSKRFSNRFLLAVKNIKPTLPRINKKKDKQIGKKLRKKSIMEIVRKINIPNSNYQWFLHEFYNSNHKTLTWSSGSGNFFLGNFRAQGKEMGRFEIIFGLCDKFQLQISKFEIDQESLKVMEK